MILNWKHILLLLSIVLATACASKVGINTGVFDPETNNKQAAQQHFRAGGDINSYVVQFQSAASVLQWALLALSSLFMVGWLGAARNRVQFSRSLRAAILAVESSDSTHLRVDPKAIKKSAQLMSVEYSCDKFLDKQVRKVVKKKC